MTHTLDIYEKVHSRQDFHQMDDDDQHKHLGMIVDYHDLTNTQKIHLVLVAQLYSTVALISNTTHAKKKEIIYN